VNGRDHNRPRTDRGVPLSCANNHGTNPTDAPSGFDEVPARHPLSRDANWVGGECVRLPPLAAEHIPRHSASKVENGGDSHSPRSAAVRFLDKAGFRGLEYAGRPAHNPTEGSTWRSRWRQADILYVHLPGLGDGGRNPPDTSISLATGDSGMGMSHGTIAGVLIPSLITDGSHPWQDVFAPCCKPWAE
jgi:hypothetical protein